MKKLTAKQQRVYDFVAEHIMDKGYPPSVREIAAGLGLGSTSTVHAHLNSLEEQGLISREKGSSRAISIPSLEPGRVPVLGTVSAGSPVVAYEDISGWLPYDAGGDGREYFALRIRGDSMYGAGILDGDCVVVRRQSTAVSGDIVIALIDDDATCKRFVREADRVLLMPENPDYAPIPAEQAVILGRVRAVVREY